MEAKEMFPLTYVEAGLSEEEADTAEAVSGREGGRHGEGYVRQLPCLWPCSRQDQPADGWLPASPQTALWFLICILKKRAMVVHIRYCSLPKKAIEQDTTFISLWDFSSHAVLIGYTVKHNPPVKTSLLGHRDCEMSLLPLGPALFLSLFLSGSSLSWTLWTSYPCSIFSLCVFCSSHGKSLKIYSGRWRGRWAKVMMDNLVGWFLLLNDKTHPRWEASFLGGTKRHMVLLPAEGEQPTMPAFNSAVIRTSLGG